MDYNLDVTHLLAGSTLMVSFVLLYQTRMYGILNAFAMQAVILAMAVAWQSRVQHAPHLMVTAFLALTVKAGVIPWVLRIIIRKLGIQRNIETVVGIGTTLLVAVFLTMLAILIVVPMTSAHAAATRQDLAFALAVILLGILMMITRHNAISQIVGFMSLENGLILAATGAKGMPLVVEISVAFSVLIAFLVFGIFLFRIRERFDSVDITALERFRKERLEGRYSHGESLIQPVIPAMDPVRREPT
ncbi:MAG: hypothetical protein H7833_07775 [Magnetococcus sp. DMHC-1]